MKKSEVPFTLNIVLRVLGITVATELLVLFPLDALGWPRGLGKAIVDVLVLVVVSVPLLYFFVVKVLAEKLADKKEFAMAKQVIDNLLEAVLITSPRGEIQYVNKAFTDVTGYGDQEVMGKNTQFLHSEKHEPIFYKNLLGILRNDGCWKGEIWNRRKNGDVYPEWLSICSIRNERGDLTNYVSVSSDISERKLAEEKLRHLANHDSLTGLPNRSVFGDRLKQALAQAKRDERALALLFLDLDNFKIINDTLGHQMGDRLLVAVAERLAGCVRESDTVARMGGDEFTIILLGVVDAQDTATAARKISATLAQPFLLDGRELFVTSSIGITMFPLDGSDPETLLRHADTAMYHAKEKGRNNYQFYMAYLNAAVFERLVMEGAMRKALERGEFNLFYQPQVDAQTFKIIGMEALIRWMHPEMGLIASDRFIPLAEETGLILPLGEWVLRTACAQNKTWQKMGLPPVKVGVNLSACQFQDDGFLEKVAKILEETGLDPDYLELELTESLVMQNAPAAAATLEKLCAMGIHIAIDDFGTGYSSLSYLKRFPVDKLKIDRSFVRDVTTNPDDAALAEAIIALDRSLKLRTVAEGVETEEQLLFLQKRGCDEIQGYLFSHPLPAEALEKMLQDGMILTEMGRQAKLKKESVE